MERFLLVYPLPPSNDVILASKSINLNADNTKEVVEFKLQGKNYIQCNDAYEATNVTNMALG